MTSDRQREANRRNAQNSTGPTSPEGRAISSRNARRHGVLSEHVVATDSERDRFAMLVHELMQEHKPATRTEQMLVERLAVLFWRERRLAQSERQQLTPSVADPGAEGIAQWQMQRAGGPAPVPLVDQLLIGRYQTMLSNQVAKTLKELRAEQDLRIRTLEG